MAEPKIGEHFTVSGEKFVRIHPVTGMDLYNTLSRCIYALRLSAYRVVIMLPADHSDTVSAYTEYPFCGGYYCKKCGKYVSKSIRPEDNLCDCCHNSFGG